ncbi:MAG: DNA mismatch repair endonuclease MutL [Dehalococcoidia bacterium]|nr:DNA mismatch repair endonuclease MutL [Dehalococcoidia bacterium]
MPIIVLEPEIAARIAAGEVIEEPSSVVKELLENSLDAEARRIWIVIEGGGLSLIQIRDDGAGIPNEDVQAAFLRHATSKLSNDGRLDCVYSLGFRGEALPSIAAVAEVEMLTRTRSEDAGTYVRLVNGAVAAFERRAAPVGTTVTVRDLFMDIPARRKFMPSTQILSGRISHLVSRLALGAPGVRLSLVSERRRSFASDGTGSVRDVVSRMYGPQVAEAMLELAPGAVTGFVSPPSVTRGTRGNVSLYVNGRWVINRSLVVAVEEAYHGLLMVGRFPIAVVSLNVPFNEVDINIHPSKREVRLLKDREMFGELQRAVRRVLLESSPVPGLLTEVEAGPPFTAAQPTFVPGYAHNNAQAASFWAAQDTIHAGQAAETQPAPLPLMRVLGQLGSTYIVAEGPDGMYMVDQHAAHERVLFEKILGDLESGACESQGLLEPIVVEMSEEQRTALRNGEEIMKRVGFGVESFGENTVLIRSVPSIIKEGSATQALADTLDQMAQGKSSTDWQERIAASLACHGAIKAAQPLRFEEMRQLILQLEEAANPKTCPHGRPTTLYLSSSQLERQFGRR